MALLRWLKQLIGIDDRGRDGTGTAVPVEREPAAESERAVKEPVSSDDADRTPAAPSPEAADEPVDALDGIGPAYAERLGEAGVETVGDLAGADAADLDAATDLGEGRLAGWIEQARDR